MLSKRATVLIVSLVANIVLLVILFFSFHKAQTPAATAVPLSAAKPPDAKAVKQQLLRLLESASLSELIAAGVPEKTARDLVRGRIYARFQNRVMETRRSDRPVDGRYWVSPNRISNRARQNSFAVLKAHRELDDSLRALGERDLLGESYDSKLEFISHEKQEKLLRIKQDYEEMEAGLGIADGFFLNSDREKVTVLQEEEERDMTQLFTPLELRSYRMRTSPTAHFVAEKYGEAIQSEADYEKIYALQKAFDDQYRNPDSPEIGVSGWQMAERELQKNILGIIGKENFAAAQQRLDREHGALETIVMRLNLAPATTDSIYAMRETYSAQSLAIVLKNSLSAEARRDQIKALGEQARAAIESALGPTGSRDYSDYASWLGALETGRGFGTHASDSYGEMPSLYETTYPVSISADKTESPAAPSN